MRVRAVAVGLALCATLSACGSSSPLKGVRGSILAAALAQRSVHWTGIFSADLYGTEHTTIDVNADSGVERETFPRGETAEIRLVHGIYYVKADAAALRYYVLALTPSQAQRYAGRWISVPRKGDLQVRYSPVANDLTLASLADLVIPRGKVKVSRTTSHGTRFIEVVGWPPGTPRNVRTFSTHKLTARAVGKPLPVMFSAGCGMMCESSGSFSDWNEPVIVRAPTSSTPIATVRS